MTLNTDDEVPVMLWGMQSTPSLPSLPGPLWWGVVAPDRVLSMGQIELNCVLILNWILWNRTVFDIESVSKHKTILILNWVVWNRTVYRYKNEFGINDQQWLMCHKTQTKSNL